MIIPLLIMVSIISITLSYILLPFIMALIKSLSQGEIAILLTVLIFGAGLLVIYWKLFRTSKFSSLTHPVFFCLSGFVINGTIINISSYFAELSPLSSRWIYICIALPVLFVTVYTFIETIYQVRLITFIFLGIATIVILLMTFTDKYGNFPSLNGVIRDRSAAYIFGKEKGPVSLATLSSITLNVGFILFLTAKKSSRLFIGFVSLSSFIGLVGAGGRMGWIASTAGLMISSLLMVVFLGKSFKYLLKISMVLIIFLTFVILFIRLLPQTHFPRRLNSLLLLFIGENTFANVANKRITLWGEALNVIAKYPLGVGFSYFSVPGLSGLSPHNDYLNLILGTGFTGFILYMSMVFLTGFSVLKGLLGKKNELVLPYMIISKVVFVVYFFSAFTEAVTISNSVAIFLVWFFIALGFTISRKKIKI